MSHSDKIFRWGIWGTGDVAAKFAAGLSAVDKARLAWVLSREADRAEAFARRVGAARGHADLAAALAEADAVYIATPTRYHADHAVAALEAGLHVLVEKPLAANAAEARRIAEAAQKAQCFAMEAMWTRFQPALAAARKCLVEDVIGTPRLLHGEFCIATLPGGSLYDPKGGGALRQRGIYPLSLAANLLGFPVEAAALCRMGPEGSDCPIDEDIVIQMRHPQGALSQLRASVTTNAPNALAIFGDKGTLRFEGRIWRPSALRLTSHAPRATAANNRNSQLAWLRETSTGQAVIRLLMPFMDRRGSRVISTPAKANGYGHQAEAVMAGVAAGELESPLMPLSESVALAELMDRLLIEGKHG